MSESSSAQSEEVRMALLEHNQKALSNLVSDAVNEMKKLGSSMSELNISIAKLPCGKTALHVDGITKTLDKLSEDMNKMKVSMKDSSLKETEDLAKIKENIKSLELSKSFQQKIIIGCFITASGAFVSRWIL